MKFYSHKIQKPVFCIELIYFPISLIGKFIAGKTIIPALNSQGQPAMCPYIAW